MEFEIKRINAWSVLKIIFVFYLGFGAFLGIFFAFISNLLSAMILSFGSSYLGEDVFIPSGFSIFINIISFALFFAVFGSVVTLFFIGIYNLLSSMFGGIKFELQSIDDNRSIQSVDTQETLMEEPVDEKYE